MDPATKPRDRILLAAHDLFYRDGIRATGIDKVIEHAKVTKVTFYRAYPSKDDLIRAYLAYRHERWMNWLRTTLAQHLNAGQSPIQALLATFESWWSQPDYRGCAFINTAAELGSTDPAVLDIARQHKADMSAALETLVPRGRGRSAKAEALTLAVDGAIVHAQMGAPVEDVLATLKLLCAPIVES